MNEKIMRYILIPLSPPNLYKNILYLQIRYQISFQKLRRQYYLHSYQQK